MVECERCKFDLCPLCIKPHRKYCKREWDPKKRKHRRQANDANGLHKAVKQAGKATMKKHLRVVTEATSDNKDSAPLIFDVVVDENSLIVGDHPIFAHQTSTKKRSRYSYPFVIDSKGRVDWGMEHERGAKTNLREKPMIPGSIIRLKGSGYDETFRIKELVSLAD
jgi:hypothetical protein